MTAALFPRLFAQQSGRTVFPSLDADPLARDLAARMRDGAYDWRDLAEIALWASGAAEFPPRNQRAIPANRSYRDTIFAAAEELARAEDLPADPRARGEYTLTFLYQRFLKNYALNQTRLDEILTTGRYNCVSSAVLYTIFAGAVGLEVRGVMTRDHAFATVLAETDQIDVETTNPYGFDPGNRREFHDDFGKVTGFAYVPARNYRDRVTISPLELASLILSNRIADLESRGRYVEAVPLAVNRAALLAGRRNPTDSEFFASGERDLQDRLLNYGVSLMKSGKETDALEWAALVGERLETAGSGPRWEEFSYSALNNLVVKHLRARRVGEARDSVSRYGVLVSATHRRSLAGMIADADILARANAAGEDPAALLRDIEAARAGALVPPARAEELRTFVIMKEGERVAASEGASAALGYIERAIAQYGRNARLDESLRVHRENRLAELHNAFARLFNGRNFEAARTQALTALEEFPNNRQLRQDLEITEEALRRR
jgi:tetratricopeptide (TPR) repeat protein